MTYDQYLLAFQVEELAEQLDNARANQDPPAAYMDATIGDLPRRAQAEMDAQERGPATKVLAFLSGATAEELEDALGGLQSGIFLKTRDHTVFSTASPFRARGQPPSHQNQQESFLGTPRAPGAGGAGGGTARPLGTSTPKADRTDGSKRKDEGGCKDFQDGKPRQPPGGGSGGAGGGAPPMATHGNVGSRAHQGGTSGSRTGQGEHGGGQGRSRDAPGEPNVSGNGPVPGAGDRHLNRPVQPVTPVVTNPGQGIAGQSVEAMEVDESPSENSPDQVNQSFGPVVPNPQQVESGQQSQQSGGFQLPEPSAPPGQPIANPDSIGQQSSESSANSGPSPPGFVPTPEMPAHTPSGGAGGTGGTVASTPGTLDQPMQETPSGPLPLRATGSLVQSSESEPSIPPQPRFSVSGPLCTSSPIRRKRKRFTPPSHGESVGGVEFTPQARPAFLRYVESLNVRGIIPESRADELRYLFDACPLTENHLVEGTMVSLVSITRHNRGLELHVPKLCRFLGIDTSEKAFGELLRFHGMKPRRRDPGASGDRKMVCSHPAACVLLGLSELSVVFGAMGEEPLYSNPLGLLHWY